MTTTTQHRTFLNSFALFLIICACLVYSINWDITGTVLIVGACLISFTSKHI